VGTSYLTDLTGGTHRCAIRDDGAVVGDEDYDDLFAAPVDEFVARRDALARRLKTEGEKEQAAEVKAWRRPSRVVGALNRLALADEGSTAAFVDAARAVGSSRGPSLREANDAFRAAVRTAATAAVAGLDDARPSDLGEVTNALLTLGSDEDALASFESGRLLDLPAAGQGGFGFGLASVDDEPAQRARPKAGSRKAAAKQVPGQEDELAARRLVAERRRLEADVDAATTVLSKAERSADDARDEATAAHDGVDEARRALAEAEAAATDADSALGRAEAEVADATAALDEAEAALADAQPEGGS
jgi:hypothetical protein